MSRRIVMILFAAVLAFSATGMRPAKARDLDYERLADSFNRLMTDQRLSGLAPAPMERARAAVQAVKEAHRGDRPHAIYMAEHRIDIARTAAESELMETERAKLQRENDRLQLAAARRDADQARRELEQQRLQAQIRAEEAERLAHEAETARAEGEQASHAAEAARAEADQAKRMADAQAKAAALAKKEAELAGSISSPSQPAPAAAKRRMTLADNAFASGKLAKAGTSRIPGIVDFVNAAPGQRIHIQASAGGDRTLATQRAEAVRDALVGAGVAASRIHAEGINARKSRQVDITLEGSDPG